ncbi:MAG: 50S ribosomal protein L25, partial [Planctomycetes bacterium]|nr:50S ribosomal protein L25 [Planctomycetota bacterium]
METTTLKAVTRTVLGTLASRKLRAQGLLPAIIYGHGEPPESVALGGHEIEVALNRGARTLQVELNGTTQQFLIKEVQYNHMGQIPRH